MAKQPDWKKRDKQTDRQNIPIAVTPPKGAESKTVTAVGKGSAVLEDTEVVESKNNGKKKAHAKKFTRDHLEGMKMKNLRIIGDKLGVKDNVKAELIDKIMEANG